MDSPKSPSDLCWGASAIAETINRSVRQTFWLLENGLLPAKKVGRVWCASRARLIAHCTGDDVVKRRAS
jgi:hypothetical protein